MDRHIVISSDCHAGLPPERYRDYLDPQYREAFDQALPIQLQMNELAEKKFLIKDVNDEWRAGNEDGLSGAWDHEARLRVLDGDGIAGEIVFPDGITERNSAPFGGSLGMPTEGVVPELQWAGARAHNRWLAELVQMAPERRVGVALCPALWDVDEAVKEVEWARANGLKGVMLPVMWGSQDPYHHPKYDPLWAACQDNELVIHFHSGPAPMNDYMGTFPPEPGQLDMPGGIGIYIAEVAFYLVRPLTFMLWGGVFERFPKTKVAMTEGTAIWVPEYLELHDHRYTSARENQKLGDFKSHLKMKPSEYFKRNVRVGASCMHKREADLRHEIGLDVMMWGSDYPHPEGTWPDTRSCMGTTFEGIPVDEAAKMLGDNAIDFYGFDREKLAPIAARVGPDKEGLLAGKA